MFKSIKNRLRQRLLRALRPGRNHQELLTIIERSEAILSDEQRQMLEAMFHFQETRVREVMMPRSDIQALDVHLSIPQAAEIIASSKDFRFPIMDRDIDHMLGVVYVKDLFAAYIKPHDISLKDLVRPMLTVSELAYIPRLLLNMRETKTHMAMVVDEFGGTVGLITFTDLLEEIMGPMDENSIDDSSEYVRGDNGSIEVSARMHVEDLQEILNIDLPKGDYDTVGGLILTELGRIPVRGERFLAAGFDFHIQEADPRRVLRVLIKPLP